MNVVVVQQPVVEPVTVQEAFVHLRVDADPDAIEQHVDYLAIQGHIATARQQVETFLKRSLIQQTLRLTLSGWGMPPCDRLHGERGLQLRRPPVQSIVSVTYRDAANALQTVDSAQYFVTEERLPRLLFTAAFGTPALYPRPDAVAVTYVAGYPPGGQGQADPRANVPQQIRSAVLLGTELLYDRHTPEEQLAIERAWTNLLSPLRITNV